MRSLPILIAVTLAACGQEPPAPAPEAIVPTVEVERIQVRSLASGLRVTGNLVAREEAAVNAELAGYRVARVLVEEGDRVRAGQPLALLDGTLLAGQAAQAAAQLAQASVAAERTAAEQARVAGLQGSGVVADESIAQRGFEARNAAAGVGIARAQLADVRTRQARLVLRAPVSGIILERALRPGDVSGGGGAPAFRIARDGLVELDAEMPERGFAAIKVGDSAPVTPAFGVTVSGKIRLLSPRIDAQSRLGRVRIALPRDAALRVGGSAAATLASAPRGVASVSQRAVRYTTAGPTLAMLSRDQRVGSVPVETGIRDGGFVELRRGPPPGSTIVSNGGALLLAGDKVRPVTRRER